MSKTFEEAKDIPGVRYTLVIENMTLEEVKKVLPVTKEFGTRRTVHGFAPADYEEN